MNIVTTPANREKTKEKREKQKEKAPERERRYQWQTAIADYAFYIYSLHLVLFSHGIYISL